MSTQILVMVATLLGGLAFFLYGMSIMSTGLEQVSGGGLERTMRRVTSNEFSGFFLGSGITVAIQSSSAFTVMLVGLVNSGILDFSSTFGMIMGSNVGTTLTAWILSLAGIKDDNFFLTLLQPSTFAPLLAFIGIVLRMLSKKDKHQNIGMIFIGFAVLMFGMDLMSASMESVRTIPGFNSFLATLESPIVALLVSTVFTGVIQSSAATIGIVQALALTGNISYQMAIPMVLGANIGTCVTALISAVGTNKNAKRVVAMHFFVNVFGSVLCMAILYVLKAFNFGILGVAVSMVGVALIHTAFNVINTVVLLPLKKLIIKFCIWVVPDGKEEKTHTIFLDERLFNNTNLVISECRRYMNEMAEISRKSIIDSVALVENYDEAKVQQIKDSEMLVDKYEDRLGTYLVKISSGKLGHNESHEVARMLHGIGDFERISDHALNICEVAQEIKEKNIIFSEEARAELKAIKGALLEITNITIDSFVADDAVAATKVEPLEQVIDVLKSTLKARHIERLQKGNCTTQMGFVFNDLITNYERVSDHCSNIAVYTIKLNSDMLDTHKYLRGIRETETNYAVDYKNYLKKYSV